MNGPAGTGWADVIVVFGSASAASFSQEGGAACALSIMTVMRLNMAGILTPVAAEGQGGALGLHFPCSFFTATALSATIAAPRPQFCAKVPTQ